MKIDKTIGVALVCLLLSGCGNKQSGQKGSSVQTGVLPQSDISLTEINIDMGNKDDAYPADSLFEFDSFIKLETTNDNLIGDVEDILFLNDKIVIEDMKYSKTVTVYDMRGRFLTTVSKLGPGPEEYTSLNYVSVSPVTGMIQITNPGGGKVLFYDENGRFRDSKKTPFFMESYEPLGDNLVVAQDPYGFPLDGVEGKPCIIVSDWEGNVKYHAFQSDFHENSPYWVSRYPIHWYGDKLLYFQVYREQDTIYQITPDGAVPYYYLNIKGRNKITEEDKKVQNFNEKILKKMAARFDGDFMEMKDYAVFDICVARSSWPRFAVYSKAKKKCYYCTGKYFDPRLHFVIGYRNLYKDNVFVTCVQASHLLSKKDMIYSLCKKEDADALFDGLTEDSNPVLLFYRVKI